MPDVRALGEPEQSLRVAVEQSLQSQPKLTFYEQGKRNLQLGSVGLAIAAFQKELTEHPDSIPALNGLAVGYNQLGRGDVAQEYLDRALTLDPSSAVTLNNLAYLNLTEGNTAVALAYGARAQSLPQSKRKRSFRRGWQVR